jgi:Fic family protein
MSELAQSSIPVGLHLIINSITDSFEKSMVARWRKEYENHNEKRVRRRKIMNAVAEGYDTLSEIVAETQIAPATARRIILELAAKNRIRPVRTKNTNNRIELRYEIV